MSSSVPQGGGPVDEVAEDGHQLAVVALLEVLPAEVVVLGLGGVGREHVAQHVLLAREVLQVLVRPHGPAARGRDLVAFEVEELVGGNVVREDEAVAVGLQHRREHDAVEDDVVLADEVDQPGVRRLPPLLPAVGQELLRVGDVADRGVEPHVEDLALGALHGHGHAPVEVAGDGARLQAAVQPALDLAVDVGAPLLVALEDPFAEPGLIVLEREVPVGGLLLDGLGAAELALGVDQLLGAERAAAFLALVAVGAFIAALGAGAHDVAVRQELLRLGVVVLLALLRDELARVVEPAEELGGRLGVHLGRGAAIDVEMDAEPLERVLDDAVVAVHDVLRGAALLAGLDGDGHAVLVGAADIQDFPAAHAQVAHIDVCGYIDTGEVADVDRTVGVRQRAGHEGSLELFVHYFVFFSLPIFCLIRRCAAWTLIISCRMAGSVSGVASGRERRSVS